MLTRFDPSVVQKEFSRRVFEEKEFQDYTEVAIELINRLRIVFVSMILTAFAVFFLPEKFLEGQFTFKGYKPSIYKVLGEIYIHSVTRMIETDNVEIVISSPLSVINYGIQFAMMIAFVVNLPFLLIQIYKFVEPALYIQEKEILKNGMISIAGLFLLGSFIAYVIVVPVTINVLNIMTAPLVDYGNESNLGLLYNFETILDIVMWTVFSAGILYTIPGIIYVLVILDILDVEYLIKNRKNVIMALLTLAAIITPDPTMVSMVVISGPLIVIYEVIIQSGYRNKRSSTYGWRKM